ncbi:MAG: hypothetical protein MJ175_11990 [Clostridia bacterium]|nr:hypothetical protein [Clostridia bacterium]
MTAFTGCGAQTAVGAETETTMGQIYEDTEGEESVMTDRKQLIPDPTFRNGFTIRSQKDHENGDNFEDLGVFPDDSASPAWLIVQWDSGPCLWEDRVPAADGVLTDGRSKWVTLNGDGASLRLDSAAYYEMKPDGAAAAGDFWPHLLLECTDFGYAAAKAAEKEFYSCSADELLLSFDLNMSAFSCTPNEKDWVEADQFLMYFYVKGKHSNDFVWFGLQLFDSRWERNTPYVGIDGGKADASGSLIYSIGLTEVYKCADGGLWKNKAVPADGKWIHIEIDLTPHLNKMFRSGSEMEYFSSAVSSLDDLYIDGMNLGFETIGTFDTEMGIRNLSLVSVKH